MAPERKQFYKLKPKLEQAKNLQVGDILQCKDPWTRLGLNSHYTIPAETKFLIKDIKLSVGIKRLLLVTQFNNIDLYIWIPIDLFIMSDFLTICDEN